MSNTLKEIANKLKNNKKVQLLYAFNGTGKTRLSKEFKESIAPKADYDAGEALKKIIYYNAFTEDLFYWDNDLLNDDEIKLKIHSNAFTKWIFETQGKEQNVIDNFHHYTDDKLTPVFNEDYTEVKFSFKRGNEEAEENIKISKGEESSFIWSVFYSLMEQIILELNIPEVSDRSTNDFDDLEYILIDDPVSSLDDNHLIELAVNIATLINNSDYTNGNGLKFIISTHNPLFYNVLYNELNLNKKKGHYMLLKNDDGSFTLDDARRGDSNKSFSYHLHLRYLLEEAIKNNEIEKYHFTLLRNLYEKTANFLGYEKWSDLLPDDKEAYFNRIIQFTSHSTLSNDDIREPTQPEKEVVKLLFKNLIDNYSYWKEEENNESTN
ncbi:anticodon nuclease [Malaciobacter halophilus]|nr:AAA family ATPase [Malaciobacter halophilus]RYA23598.1 anticodon nuclease [Malaciobacter halophilus]